MLLSRANLMTYRIATRIEKLSTIASLILAHRLSTSSTSPSSHRAVRNAGSVGSSLHGEFQVVVHCHYGAAVNAKPSQTQSSSLSAKASIMALLPM